LVLEKESPRERSTARGGRKTEESWVIPECVRNTRIVGDKNQVGGRRVTGAQAKSRKKKEGRRKGSGGPGDGQGSAHDKKQI